MKGMSIKEAVENAIASAELESYVLTQKQKEVFEKLASEELAFEDVYIIIEKELEELGKDKPELFVQNK